MLNLVRQVEACSDHCYNEPHPYSKNTKSSCVSKKGLNKKVEAKGLQRRPPNKKEPVAGEAFLRIASRPDPLDSDRKTSIYGI